jgi:tight adherence protein C
VNPLLLVAVLTVALSLLLLVLAVAMGSAPATGVARSLEVIQQGRVTRDVARHQLPARERLLVPATALLQRAARRLSPAHTPARLQRLLDFAGNPPAWPLDRLLAAKGAGLFVGALVGALLGGLDRWSLLYAPVLAAFLFWLPDLLVHNAGQHRQQAIRRSMADALDMLTVCVEAGLGFDAALLQVARKTSGPLAGEFSRVLQEVQLGRSRTDALQHLVSRTDVEELRVFVAALVQADRMGIPIANVLREQSQQMRLIRRQNAEERAQKVTVKILFPLIFCIFPALMIVVMGPAVMRLVAVFATTATLP